jgi:urocanate reductase
VTEPEAAGTRGSQSKLMKESEMSEEKEGSKKLTRRDFVKGAAAVAGVGALASCAPAATPAPAETAVPCPTCPPAEECPPCVAPGMPETWDKEADVIVVGFGGAGAAASIEAADAGASVLLLEKLPVPGGNSVISSGSFAAPGSPIQKAEGITGDSPEKMYEYWMSAGLGVTDPELTRTICDNCLEAWQWLTNLTGRPPEELWGDLGFTAAPFVAEKDVLRRTHRGLLEGNAGAWEFATVEGAVEERNAIEVMLETAASELIVNGDGEVVGVAVDTADGERQNFKARQAVVLTSGDFSRNDDMAKAYSISTFYAVKMTAPGCTGDGIRMAQKLGAAVACMEGTMGGLITIQPDSTAGVPKGKYILVNAQGARYVNEGALYPEAELSNYWIAYRTFQQDGNRGFAIMDEAVGKGGGSALVSSFSDDLVEETEKGYVFKADTIKELATKCGMAPSILSNTIDMWNEDVAAGLDRLFHRTTGMRGATMLPIDQPPFYAVPLTGDTITTLGGVKTNGQAQVIDLAGQVIPRLYAAGATVGGFIGPFYQHSGGGIAQAYTMGRISGQNAAAEEPWE